MKKHLIYAIGDVHGCLKTLDALWLKIEEHMNNNPAEKRTLIFLGDYVDRGPDSAGVIHRLIELRRLLPEYGIELVTLKGNHEDMMYAGLEHPMSSDAGLWYTNGGSQTLASYGEAGVPDSHIQFIKSLKIWHQIGRFIFVHAGIEPFTEMEYQSELEMIWSRDWVKYNGPFDDDEKLFVVHGHTPIDGVNLLDYQLNIDTACVFGGILTCVVIDEDQTDNNFEYIQEMNIDRNEL